MENRDIQLFTHEQFGEVRTVLKDGDPWFVAADVCRILELGQITRAVSRLDDDEHQTTLISNKGSQGRSEVNIVNEPGLYTLVLGSRKQEAKAFKRWVTHDVLPAIRRTGRYAAPGSRANNPETIVTLLTALQKQQEENEELRKHNNWLSSQQAADLREQRLLQGAVDDLPEKATTQFLLAMADMVKESGRICALDDGAQYANLDLMVGYEDDDYYYLIPRKAYAYAEHWCRMHGEALLVTYKTLNRCLRTTGTILPAKSGATSTRNKLIDRRTVRLLWLDKETMWKLIANAREGKSHE